MTTPPYEPRTYRTRMARPGLVGFRVAVKETDLWVLAARDFSAEVREIVIQERQQLEAYIAGHPGFLTTLTPWPADPFAPPVVREMIEAAAAAGVGPMAAVAGALAARVGRQLAPLSPEVIVENGGDIFLAIEHPATVALFAGAIPFKSPGGAAPRPQPQSFGGVHLFGQRGAFLEPRPSRRRLCPGPKRRPGRCRGHRAWATGCRAPTPSPRPWRGPPPSPTSWARSSSWARSWAPGAGWNWCP